MTSRPVKEVNYVLVVNTTTHPKAVVKVDFIEAGLSLAKTADRIKEMERAYPTHSHETRLLVTTDPQEAIAQLNIPIRSL